MKDKFSMNSSIPVYGGRKNILTYRGSPAMNGSKIHIEKDILKVKAIPLQIPPI